MVLRIFTVMFVFGRRLGFEAEYIRLAHLELGVTTEQSYAGLAFKVGRNSS